MPASRRFAVRLALHAALLLLTALPVFSSRAVAFEAGFSGADELELPVAPLRKEALLSILYEASTYGELHPCPT